MALTVVEQHIAAMYHTSGQRWMYGPFLLEHGTWFEPRDRDHWPECVRPGVLRECFRNAANLVLRNPERLAYCEGIAHDIIPCEHAWVVDLESGHAYDPTWRRLGSEYLGVVISTEYLRESLVRTGYYGVLLDFVGRSPILSGHARREQWCHEDYLAKRLQQVPHPLAPAPSTGVIMNLPEKHSSGLSESKRKCRR